MKSCMHAIAALSLILPAALPAQSLWPRKLAGRGELGLEWVRPTFDDAEFGFTRGVWIIDGRVQVTPRLNLIAALPQLTAPTDAGSDREWGNPFFGVEFTDTLGRPEFTIGLRRGNASFESASPFYMGYLGDYDRLEQVLTDGWILNTIGHVRPWNAPDGGFAELRFGVTGIFGLENGASSTSMLLDYGIRIGRETGTLGFGTGLTGRWPITGTSGGSLESAVHQVFGDVTYLKGVVQPTVGVRLPFDEELGEVLDYALTFGVKVQFK